MNCCHYHEDIVALGITTIDTKNLRFRRNLLAVSGWGVVANPRRGSPVDVVCTYFWGLAVSVIWAWEVKCQASHSPSAWLVRKSVVVYLTRLCGYSKFPVAFV